MSAILPPSLSHSKTLLPEGEVNVILRSPIYVCFTANAYLNPSMIAPEGISLVLTYVFEVTPPVLLSGIV